MRDHDDRWDEEPFGDLDTGLRRHWRRPWNNYLAVVVGLFGLCMLIGGVGLRSAQGIVAALLVLGVPVALMKSDGPRARPRQPPPPPPTLRTEIAWAVVAVLLVVVGLTVASL